MYSKSKHIVDHTRSKNGKKRYSICGERISSIDWTFHDKEHAEKTIESGSPIKVCRKCLKMMETYEL